MTTSPSISPDYPTTEPRLRAALRRLVEARAGGDPTVPVVSEVDLFLRLCPAPTIGVTGTKGKTTTSALTAAILAADPAHPVVLGGNIGMPLVERLPELTPGHRVVIELSELQLPTLSRGTTVAVYTHVTADHLDRHGTLEAYRAVKRRLAELVDPDGALVLNAEDPVVAGVRGRRPRARPSATGASAPLPGGVGVVDGWIVADGVERLAAGRRRRRRRPVRRPDHAARRAGDPRRAQRLERPGRGRASGCCSASRRTRSAPRSPASAASSTGSSRSRRSTASASSTTRRARSPTRSSPRCAPSTPPLVLIAGGRAKGVDLTRSPPVVAERAAAAVLIGESGPTLEARVPRRRPRPHRARARPGRRPSARRRASPARRSPRAGATADHATVLLSPAAASFDMFADYAARGRAFKDGRRRRSPRTEPREGTDEPRAADPRARPAPAPAGARHPSRTRGASTANADPGAAPRPARRPARAPRGGLRDPRRGRGARRDRHPDGLLVVGDHAATSSPDADTFATVGPQILWAILGIVVMLVMMRVDYRYLRLVSVPFFLVALVAARARASVAGRSTIEVGGSARWLKLGPLPAVHPAEIAKLALVVYLAHWFAKRGTRVGGLWAGTVPFLIIIAPVIFLVFIEPDLGHDVVITLTAFTMFFVAGANLIHLGVDGRRAPCSRCSSSACSGYQMDRIRACLDPWRSASATASTRSRACSPSAWAASSDRPRARARVFVPNAVNDFVFAEVGQEFGLVGGGRGHRALPRPGLPGDPDRAGARRTRSAPCWPPGSPAWLCLQAFINIGVVVALLPITGITLPFISAGGSSLIISFAAVGILLSISRETVEKGTWNDDANPDRGRRDGRAHLPGAGRRRGRSARRPDAPELRWLGGHRGLEARSSRRPASRCAGSPCARCARSSSTSTPSSTRSGSARPSRRPRRSWLASARPPSSRPAATSRSRPAGRGAARHPGRAVGRQRHPRPQRARHGPAGRRAGGRLRGDLRRRSSRRAGRPCYLTGTPIRDTRDIDREAAARSGWTSPPDERVLLVFGGSQAVRRFNAAVAEALPRLVERVDRHPRDRRDGLRRRAGRPRGAAGSRARSLPAVPVPARRDARRAGRRGPGRRTGGLVDARRGDRARAADGRRAVSARRRPPAGQRARRWSRRAPRGSSRTRSSTPTRCSTRPRILDDPAAHARDARGGPGARPARAPPTRSRTSCMAAARRDRPLPGRRRRIEPARRGAGAAMTAAPSTRSPIGTDIQRRIGVKTSRDEPLARFTTMRVGGPADLFAEVHNLFELRALVRFARPRELPALRPGAGLRPGHQRRRGPRPGHPGSARRARASRATRYTADSGVPMARAATETQQAGLSGLEFGLAIPGTVGGAVWANAGAHESDIAGVLESASVLAGDGDRGGRAGARARASRTATAGSSMPAATGAPETRDRGDVRARAGRRRGDQGAARRDPPLAPGAPAARAAVGRQRLPQPAGRLGRPAHRRGRAQGPADRRRRRVARSTPTSSSTTRRGRPRTSAASGPCPCRGRSRGTASSSSSRSSSSATGPAGRPAA